ncbi:MFS transporter [Mycobacterium sp. 1245801.1]|uniref:MFS transporter n=1 Tax=Mycobacterium sp. 1245801.1 TaxID=1834075 RepID=UPI0007FDA702|nr:MFS transporter [Mycobacterium sp. 1245801.1]OBJ15091.1 MFS transporter [Mycobacterium sp. 1245801.1]
MTIAAQGSTDLSAPPGGEEAGPGMRRVALASLAGSVLEWYDFFLYGFAATLVFGPLFFPRASSTAGVLAALGTFAVGFVARPLGGVLFGHLGDRLGRKKMLVATLLIMGIPSFLIGLLPSYAAIGWAAPALLVLLRFLQGVGLGGEWAGAVLVVTETSPQHRSGFWGSLVQTGSAVGQGLATGSLFILASTLSEHSFVTWGWRVPFLFGLALGVVGLFIRLRVIESPEFTALRRSGELSPFPLREAVRQHGRTMLICFAVYLGGVTVPFFIETVFLTGYGTKTLGLPSSSVLLGISAVHVTVFWALTVLGGWLADRYGADKVIRGGLLALLTLPAAGLLAVLAASATLPSLLTTEVLIGAPLWVVWGALPKYLAESFPARVRYTGMSLSGQSSTIIGGLIPLLLTSVVAHYGGALWPVAVTTTAVAAIGLLASQVGSPAHARERASGSPEVLAL